VPLLALTPAERLSKARQRGVTTGAKLPSRRPRFILPCRGSRLS
jgi:hypothetical protein